MRVVTPRARRQLPVPRDFAVLRQLQPEKPDTLPKVAVTSDDQVQDVKAEFERLAGGTPDALVDCLAKVLRLSLDRSYAGAATGRFHLAQLSKTEKAHTGSLFEIALQQELDLPDGHDTDYQVLQYDVDAKYTHTAGGSPSWMIGPEIEGNVALLATADDYAARWSAWLVWVTPDRRRGGANRDAKASLNLEGRTARVTIAENAQLPFNGLVQRPGDTVEIMSLQGRGHGQRRINELCRRFDGVLLSRVTIETVAQQLDPAKRMRENGGARTVLAGEGIMVIGHEANYVPLLKALNLPRPAKGEFLPLRVVPTVPDDPEETPVFFDRHGRSWRRAGRDEAGSAVPQM
jgi:hypothetical protein